MSNKKSVKAVMIGQKGGAGKTMLGKLMPEFFYNQIDVLNASEESGFSVKESAKMMMMKALSKEHVLFDIGASEFSDFMTLIMNNSIIRNKMDFWLIPITPEKDYQSQGHITADRLVQAGVSKDKIIFLFNKFDNNITNPSRAWKNQYSNFAEKVKSEGYDVHESLTFSNYYNASAFLQKAEAEGLTINKAPINHSLLIDLANDEKMEELVEYFALSEDENEQDLISQTLTAAGDIKSSRDVVKRLLTHMENELS